MSYSFLSSEQEPVFSSGVVKPFECLSAGWQLIKDQYFLFVGICLIIVVLVSCIPFTGIIYGAWMAGIYYALLGRMRGEPASFNAIGIRFWLFLTGLCDRAAEWPALRPVLAGLVYYVSTPDPTKMGGKFGGSTVVVLRYAACLLKRSASMASRRRSLSHSKRWDRFAFTFGPTRNRDRLPQPRRC